MIIIYEEADLKIEIIPSVIIRDILIKHLMYTYTESENFDEIKEIPRKPQEQLQREIQEDEDYMSQNDLSI